MNVYLLITTKENTMYMKTREGLSHQPRKRFSQNHHYIILLSAVIILCSLALAVPLVSYALSQGEPRSLVDSIVIHSIGGPECMDDHMVFKPASGSAQNWIAYFADHKEYSIHYIIDKQGNIAKGIAENQIANHAKGHNDTSIGIELVNWGDGKDPYTLEQVSTLIKLVSEIRRRWQIPVNHIFSHEAVSDRYVQCGHGQFKMKQDPGHNLLLNQIFKAGFPIAKHFKHYASPHSQPEKSSLPAVLQACQQDKPTRFQVVVEDSLSVRHQPSLHARKVGWLRPGETITLHKGLCQMPVLKIADLEGVWIKLNQHLYQGYVFSGFLEREPSDSYL